MAWLHGNNISQSQSTTLETTSHKVKIQHLKQHLTKYNPGNNISQSQSTTLEKDKVTPTMTIVDTAHLWAGSVPLF